MRDRPPAHNIIASAAPIHVALPHRVRAVARAVIHRDPRAEHAIERQRDRVRWLKEPDRRIVLLGHSVLLEIGPYLRDPRRADRRRRAGERQFQINVVNIVHRQRELPQIVLALHPPRRFTSGLHRRQEQRHKNADDRNHHEQFDQRERTLAELLPCVSRMHCQPSQAI